MSSDPLSAPASAHSPAVPSTGPGLVSAADVPPPAARQADAQPPASASPGERPVVLVTGAARRIGRSIALHLAAHGWDVLVHVRSQRQDGQGEGDDTAQQARVLGARAAVLSADLAVEADCLGLVPAAVAAMGRLDAVVNNASLFEYDSVADFSSERMDRHWRANTAPAILLARALHGHLAGRGAQGCMVNLLDQKLANPNPDYLSYTLSKAALDAAGTMLAQALAPVLRVCGVSPGVTLLSGAMTDGEFATAHTLTPLQRSSTPDDIARAVHFLLASPAITGTNLLVDGGQHLQAQGRDVMFLARGV